MSDPYIPEGEEPPRLGAVPVRFFGTYAFSWIESKRAIEPFDDEHVEHAANSRQPQFQRGVSEAKHFQVSNCVLPCHMGHVRSLLWSELLEFVVQTQNMENFMFVCACSVTLMLCHCAHTD